jgi:hypothetical protein
MADSADSSCVSPVKNEKAKSKIDTIVYEDGRWEISERNEELNMFRSLDSRGISMLFLFDSQGRIETDIMLGRNGNIISLRRYIWKDGRLIQTIFDGAVRNFDYGKTPCDTVKVTPSDAVKMKLYDVPLTYVVASPGYDNSFGKIPYENDEGYGHFIRSPYTFSGEGNKEQIRLCEEYKKAQKKKGAKK